MDDSHLMDRIATLKTCDMYYLKGELDRANKIKNRIKERLNDPDLDRRMVMGLREAIEIIDEIMTTEV